MFRFKLRTLLIATALVGLFFAGQVHVHNKAKKFVEEMIEKDDRDSYVSQSSIMPLNVWDVVCFQRRVETHSSLFAQTRLGEGWDITLVSQVDRVGLTGDTKTISRNGGASN